MKTQLRIDFEKFMVDSFGDDDSFNNYNGFNFDQFLDNEAYVVTVVENMWQVYRQAFTKYAGDHFMLYDETGSPARPIPDIPDRGDQF